MELSIVVPVYKSKLILPELLRRIDNYITPLQIDFEVILVEDSSKDGTLEVAQQFEKEYSFLKVYSNSSNLGLPATSAKGISKAIGNYIVTIDDDLEYCPSDIVRLYQVIQTSHTDIVFGIADKKYKVQGKSEHIAKLRNVLLNRFWKKPITDSFKIFKRNFVFEDGVFVMDTHFEGYLKKKADIANVGYLPVSYFPRFRGQSNYTFWKKLRMFYQMHRGF